MGHNKLREDKKCQNCGYTVDKVYCSECGQQNTETRQSFISLATHIVEDITHYDGNFWRTIKFLLFRPGKLTIEYLQGHRMRYVPPAKLYIFISFVCFFLIAVMAPETGDDNTTFHLTHNTATSNGITYQKIDKKDTVRKDTIKIDGVVLKNIHQLDSLQTSRSKDKKLSMFDYYINKARLKTISREITARDFMIGASHTLPKVLFIYMPVFAFWLWLLHGKKRWYFFDHGIFTLHYFSFLLLLMIISIILSWISGLAEHVSILGIVLEIIVGIIDFAFLLYSFFYFFRSHRKFYGETKAISRLKSFILFIINFILISIISVCTLFYIVLNTH